MNTKRFMLAFIFVALLSGFAFAEERTVTIEYVPTTLGGQEVKGYGFGFAVAYLPYRGKISYYRIEDDKGNERSELDVAAINLGYRWNVHNIRLDSNRKVNFYLDGGIDLGSQSGSRAEVINPSKTWDSPLSPGDIKKENVSEFYWAATAGPAIEYVIDNAVTLGFFVEGHIREQSFITVGGLFGILF
jgi:hypothetical protein